MQPMQTIRMWHIDQLKKAVPVLRYLLASISTESITRYRDGGDGWTVLQVLGHLRDYEAIFVERVRLTLEQDFPALPNPDPDELAAQNDYNAQYFQEVLDTWEASRVELVTLLETIEDDAIWERPGNHPRRGAFTLNDQLLLTVWHDMNHFEQITHIINDALG